MNLLLWKKILTLTHFKIITLIRPSTLPKVFFMGGSGVGTRGGGDCGGLSPVMPKILNFTHLVNVTPHQKVGSFSFSSCFTLYSLDWDHILEKRISNSFQTNLTKNFACGAHFQIHFHFSYFIFSYNHHLFEKLIGTKSFNTKLCPVELSPWIITSYIPSSYQKYTPPLILLLPSPGMDYPVPSPKSLGETM